MVEIAAILRPVRSRYARYTYFGARSAARHKYQLATVR